jgi:hypothetical protein
MSGPRVPWQRAEANNCIKKLKKSGSDVWSGCAHVCVRNQPKFLTKAELRDAARRELKVSKNAFDFAWIQVIEETGRYDWYEPLRRRLRIKS